jgi:hypothetical protein
MTAVGNIVRSWPKKASVRGWFPALDGSESEAYDYPLSSLPPCEFADPELFQRESKSIAVALWVQYNLRTIQAEERIALPAIDLLVSSSSIDNEVKEGLLQTAVDEKFHTYFHTIALWEARSRETRPVEFGESITVRELGAALAAEPEHWKRNLIQIAYAVVAEVSINAFLEVLSKSKEIRRANRDLVDKHNKDEGYHSVIFVEAAKNLLEREDSATTAFLRQQLDAAKHSFLKHDVSMYQRVFSAHAAECEFGTSSGLMTRDMSGVDRLVRVVDGIGGAHD